MNIFPNKSQLLINFLSCNNWEEKYMYIIDLGKLLPKFPKKIRIKNKFLISGCQSQTWIALISESLRNKQITNSNNRSIKLYGDSDSSIVKGLISIIFILYNNLNIQEIIDLNPQPFLEQLQLKQHLTTSRSQGMYTILCAIYNQAKNIKNT